MARAGQKISKLGILAMVTLLASCGRSSSERHQMALDYYAVGKSVSLELSLMNDGQQEATVEALVLEEYAKLGSPTPRYDGAGTEFRFNPDREAYNGMWSEQGSADGVIVVARTGEASARVFAVKADGSYSYLQWRDAYANWIRVVSE